MLIDYDRIKKIESGELTGRGCGVSSIGKVKG